MHEFEDNVFSSDEENEDVNPPVPEKEDNPTCYEELSPTK